MPRCPGRNIHLQNSRTRNEMKEYSAPVMKTISANSRFKPFGVRPSTS